MAFGWPLEDYPPPETDANVLAWTLSAHIEDLIESVPGFFDSYAAPDSNSAILSLNLSDHPTTDPILGSRL